MSLFQIISGSAKNLRGEGFSRRQPSPERRPWNQERFDIQEDIHESNAEASPELISWEELPPQPPIHEARESQHPNTLAVAGRGRWLWRN